jgi:hypothetical protein
MNVSDLFKSNLKDKKPLEKRPSSSSTSNKLNQTSAPVPMHQLLSIKLPEPVAVAVAEPVADTEPVAVAIAEPVAVAEHNVPSLLSFKLANVPSRDNEPIKSSNLSKVTSDTDHVRSLNAKYIQVINQINEELMKLKTDAIKTTAENASLKKENNELSNKVSELSNAVLNVVQQNKTLSRALGLRS